MSENIITARALSKAYDGKVLFRDVHLSIARGRAIAFIGRNGAGKSTLLKILARLVTPSSGTIEYAGAPRFGYVPEAFPRLPLTAGEYIRHMGRIEGIAPAMLAQRSAALFSAFYLDGLTDIPMKHLSKGTLQKVGVIQAILKRNDVLLLDEPLSGQDTKSRQAFVRVVEELKREGETVLLSCHEPELVGRLADEVYEIRGGGLHSASMPGDVSCDALVFDSPGTPLALPPLPEGSSLREAEGAIIIIVPSGQSNGLIVSMIQSGYRLREMRHENDL